MGALPVSENTTDRQTDKFFVTMYCHHVWGKFATSLLASLAGGLYIKWSRLIEVLLLNKSGLNRMTIHPKSVLLCSLNLYVFLFAVLCLGFSLVAGPVPHGRGNRHGP